MQHITVATPPFADIALFDKVTAATGAPEGMLARYAGTAGNGELRVVVLWETKEHADRFFTEILGPALARHIGPEPAGRPDVVGITVERAYVADLVA